MRRIRLGLSVRNAMLEQGVSAEADAPTPEPRAPVPPPVAAAREDDRAAAVALHPARPRRWTAPGDPPPGDREPPAPDEALSAGPRRRSLKRRLLGWTYPYMDYLRRFMLDGVVQLLNEARADSDGRYYAMSKRLDELQQQQAELGDALAANSQQGVALLGQLRQLSETWMWDLRDVAIRQEAHSAQLDDLLAQAQAIRGETQGLLPTIGPRLDELEIKIRPLITFDEESYAVRLAEGYAMVPRSQPLFSVMVANASSGGLEPGTRRVLKALIQPGMRVADVGANVGLLTLACAVATGPSGEVHAFEPEEGPRRQLEKTCLLNGLRWVRVHAAAVGRETERRAFHVSPVIGHSSLYELPADEVEAARTVEVQVLALDEVVSPATPFDVVKIDVEGAELDVLAGMHGHIQANDNLVIVAEFGPSHLERLGGSPQAWWEAFAKLGFEAYAISEATGTCAPVSLDEALQEVSVNIAFVRGGSDAQRRLPKA